MRQVYSKIARIAPGLMKMIFLKAVFLKNEMRHVT
jgi:hypothetical protein